ncbi:MAG: sialidase family protein [Tissierellales bacterium]
MGFANIHDVLVMDNKENIYSFYLYKNKIKMILYDKNTEKATKNTIINDCLDEYDSAISKDGRVYLVCQRIDGSIVLVSIEGYRKEEHILADEFDAKLRNINIKLIGEQIHIIYCIESNEAKNKFRVYHHSLINEKWETHVVSDITIGDFLNPISIIELGDMLVVGYSDKVDNIEQVFISTYDQDGDKWSDKIQLTTDNSMKMYLDMLGNNNKIDLCYSKLIEGNFVVTHEKYSILNGEATRVVEHGLSNPANCMYPTLIQSSETLWTIWIEYNGLISCFSEDGGLTWSTPYSWEDSKKDDFARYKFSTNNSGIIDDYNFNYGFATYGENTSFIGFGDIENAVEVPIKSEIKKKEDKGDIENMENMLDIEKNKIEDSVMTGREIKEKIPLDQSKEIQERVTIIEQALKTISEILENKIVDSDFQVQIVYEFKEKIEILEKRVDDIEYFLSKRRGPLRR